ncbi:DNA primase [Thiomicrorhabdus xiamenensis]|uniref:DNA primase n=1 Tax=Thiomicrorhabdus xiamenensis TaxID=2739063 RepID=A0A7D4NQ53_9GAMM|nr:DNA primase [Thiomicrorhabdus xiamenensis]QKI88532.1 DNA primase [Thiomicrorhabdus xiamenensis]
MAQGGTIPKSFIESVLARADLVQVINQRVPLKKAGATYKACCPFHDEKTPSFNVNPQKQFYHCFGCGASGDAITFLMEYDGLSFVEAVETLAAMYGMPVPREELSPQKRQEEQQRQQKQRDLYDVMQMAARFYRMQLRDHPQSEQAKSYLKKRGLTSEIAKEFKIGYAPPGWDSLLKGLKADASLQKQLVEAGMLVQKEGGKIYDRFRERIMFPIRDGRGRYIAFGGRILDQGQPKYLNSPETPIFHKSSTLYGLYEMRQSRVPVERILVVEGYMDVVALAQFGIRNAVATLGTATTQEHLELLFRQVNEVVFCFDGDEAGVKAAWKALDIALPMMEGQRVAKFLFLPLGEDPDSMVRKEGVEAFERRIDQAYLLSDFLLNGLQSRLGGDVQSVEGGQRFVALAEPYIKNARGVVQIKLLERVADLVGMKDWVLGQQIGVRSGSSQNRGQAKKARQQTVPMPKVLSVPLKIVRVLLKNPQWSQIFSTGLLQNLSTQSEKDYLLLAELLKRMQAQSITSQDLSQVDGVFKQFGMDVFLPLIVASDLPDDETFLINELKELSLLLARQLDEIRLGSQGWNEQEMGRLTEIKKTK